MEKEKPLNKTKMKLLEKYSEEEFLELAKLKRGREIVKAKENPKYRLALRFANEMLKRAGQPEVASLTEFHKVNRDELIKIEGDQLVVDLLPEILEVYKKKDIDHRNRKLRKYYFITVLKYLLKKIDYHLTSKDNGDFKGNKWQEYSIRKG